MNWRELNKSISKKKDQKKTKPPDQKEYKWTINFNWFVPFFEIFNFFGMAGKKIIGFPKKKIWFLDFTFSFSIIGLWSSLFTKPSL